MRASTCSASTRATTTGFCCGRHRATSARHTSSSPRVRTRDSPPAGRRWASGIAPHHRRRRIFQSRRAAPGKVLVVGSGQTGCQLAEDLFDEGRQVFLACGRAPWLPRRIEDRDVVAWLVETLSGSEAGRSPEPGGAADSQRADHRPRRRPRSALQDPPGNRSHSVGSLRGRRGWCCVLRVRPRGLRGIGDARNADACELIRTSCSAR